MTIGRARGSNRKIIRSLEIMLKSNVLRKMTANSFSFVLVNETKCCHDCIVENVCQ